MKENETKLYLAYGSNMSIEQMAYRCPGARLLGTSEIEGYRMLFRGSKTGSYASIEPCGGHRVPVLVWSIDGRDEESLDRYEGYPRFYRKESLTVALDGKPVEAMAYLMGEGRRLGAPSEWYFEVIEDAYDAFGFDKDVLYEALVDSMV